MRNGWIVGLVVIAIGCGGGSAAAAPAESAPSAATTAPSPPPSSATADPATCGLGDPAVREGTVLDTHWAYEHEGATERIRIGAHEIALERTQPGCFVTDRLYGAWTSPAQIADSLIRFDPDISPLAHPAVSS